MVDKKKAVLILDAKNFVFRAVTGLGEFLLDAEGREITGGYNAIRMINKLIEEFKPDAIVAVWDVSRPEVKMNLLPSYKENRASELNNVSSFNLEVRHRVALATPQVKSVLDHYGCIHVDIPDSEADDVVGAMVYDKDYFDGWQKIIVTTDKDYLHFAFDADVYLIRKVPVLISEANFKYVFSSIYKLDPIYAFSLHGFHAFHAMSGDKSDNIPGIPGLGMKSVSKIVSALDIYYKSDKTKLFDFDAVCFALDEFNATIKTNKVCNPKFKSVGYKMLGAYTTKLLVYRNIFEFNWSFVDPKFWVENGIDKKLQNFEPNELKTSNFSDFSSTAKRFKITSPSSYYKNAKEQHEKGQGNFCEFRRKRV